MDDAIIVSIVVTTYNHASFVTQTLDSIFMQEVDFQYEVLIGDDMSTDGTQRILEKYRDKYPEKVRLFLRNENIGATKNSYYLFLEARGKHIALLEGDDYWIHPRKLQKQTVYLENNLGFIGCCHKFITVDSNGCPIQRKLSWVQHKRVFALADFRGISLPSQPSTYVFRNIFLDKLNDYSFIYKTDIMIADRTLIMLLLSLGDFFCFSDQMGAYRIATHSESITTRLYTNNPYAVQRDLELTKKLEAVARDVLKIKIAFGSHRRKLYIIAMVRYVKSVYRRFKRIVVK